MQAFKLAKSALRRLQAASIRPQTCLFSESARDRQQSFHVKREHATNHCMHFAEESLFDHAMPTLRLTAAPLPHALYWLPVRLGVERQPPLLVLVRLSGVDAMLSAQCSPTAMSLALQLVPVQHAACLLIAIHAPGWLAATSPCVPCNAAALRLWGLWGGDEGRATFAHRGRLPARTGQGGPRGQIQLAGQRHQQYGTTASRSIT